MSVPSAWLIQPEAGRAKSAGEPLTPMTLSGDALVPGATLKFGEILPGTGIALRMVKVLSGDIEHKTLVFTATDGDVADEPGEIQASYVVKRLQRRRGFDPVTHLADDEDVVSFRRRVYKEILVARFLSAAREDIGVGVTGDRFSFADFFFFVDTSLQPFQPQLEAYLVTPYDGAVDLHTAANNFWDHCMNAVGGKELYVRQMLEIAAKLADELATLHSLGLIHGDIKPENVIVAYDKSNCSISGPRIIDWDLACFVDTSYLTELFPRHGDVWQYATCGRKDNLTYAGTPGYIDPEARRVNPETKANERVEFSEDEARRFLPAFDLYAFAMTVVALFEDLSVAAPEAASQGLMPDSLWHVIKEIIIRPVLTRDLSYKVAHQLKAIVKARKADQSLPEFHGEEKKAKKEKKEKKEKKAKKEKKKSKKREPL